MAEDYWGNGYWGTGYWGSGYWGQGGTGPPTPTVPISRPTQILHKRIKKRFEPDLAETSLTILTIIRRRRNRNV